MSSAHQQLQAAISALEAQRSVLGDAVVEASVSALRRQLAAATGADAIQSDQTLKQVSILFLDIVGSTALSQGLDPETISEVMDSALQRGTAVVTNHGGKVLKYTGDNMLAVFGADEGREDDAERAVRCGLALIDLSKTLSAELKAAHNYSGFNVRVGIHTGRVLLGGGVDGDANIRGSSVNVAARMEQTAPAGHLRISQDTYALVRGLFDVQPQEPLSVKGVDEPIRSYFVRCAKPRDVRIGMRGVEGVPTRMVGRDAELEALQDAFRLLFAPGAHRHKLTVLTVVGDAGIGKSRLLREFEAWRNAQSLDARELTGRATPQSQERPFALIGDILARQFQIADDDSVDVARQKMEHGIVPLFLQDEGPDRAKAHSHLLARLIGIEWEPSGDPGSTLEDAKQARQRAIHIVAQVFRRVVAQDGRPVVLQVEDLHWADHDSLELLAHVADVNRDVALLILATARPTLFERREEWARKDDVHCIVELAPLGSGASSLLADELLMKLPQVPDALRDLIIERAEGNPFYMEELVNVLIDRGAIETDGPWKLNLERLLATHVPTTLTGVLQARLDALATDERRTLQEASVIGPVFWEQALYALDTRATDVLPALVSRGLVCAHPVALVDELREYAFRHQLLHQVTYDSVLRRAKKELHKKVAEWLSIHSGLRAGEFLGATAEHYERAGDAENAAEFHARAAEHAIQRFAQDAVLMHVGKALALLGTAHNPELRWRLARAREETLAHRGLRDEQASELDVLEGLAETMNDDAKRAYVAERRCGRAFEMAEFGMLENAARSCIAMAERASPRANTSRLVGMRALANAQIGRGQVDAGAQLLRDALVEARRLGLRYHETLLLNSLSVAADAQNDLVGLLDLQQQSLTIAHEIGDPRAEALAMVNLGVGWCGLGELRKAREHLEHGLLLCRTWGHKILEGHALCNLSEVAQYQGEYLESVSLAESAYEQLTAAGARSWQGFALLKLGEAKLALRNYEEARQAFERARRDVLKQGSAMRHDVAAALARTALARGDIAEAMKTVHLLLREISPESGLEGTEDSCMIQWTVHRVLAAAGDPRADEWLARAHKALETQARMLADPDLKQGFLDNIPHHRETATAWARRSS